MMQRLVGYIAIVLLLVWGGTAVAGDHPLKGVALVIGQSDYEGKTLPRLANPKNDARAIDNLLEDLGFDVTRVLDGDGKKLKQEIADFTDAAKDADVALIYYSGHGIEAGGENYLAPVDADLSTPTRAGQTLIALTPLLDELGKAVPVTIVLLDACRTGAFPAGTMIQPPGAAEAVPAVENGLAVVRGAMPVVKPGVPPSSLGMVIGFAAAPGEPALDGDPGDANSPYAAALLKHFGAGGYSLADVMTMVGEEVYLKTRAQQMPWVNSSLRRVLNFGTPAVDPDPDEQAIKDGRRKLLLSISTEPDATRATVETIAASQDVPLDALYGMLKVLGVDTSGGAADLEKQLEEGARQLRQFQEQDLGTAATDPELKRLSGLAQRAQDEGAMDLALKYREQATARARDLSAERDTLEQGLKADRIEIAKTFADHAQTAALNFDYATAAKMFGEAFGQVAKWDDELALRYKRDEASALSNQGLFRGDNDSLARSIVAYDEALALIGADASPRDRADVMADLGATQFKLGERESGSKWLDDAVATLQASIVGAPRDATPADLAERQMSLANALVVLGARDGDTTRLRSGAEQFRRLLAGIRQADDPQLWATIEVNLASTLRLIADHETGTESLVQSLGVFEQAIAAIDRQKSPLDWAQAQNNYATALVLMGERTRDPAMLRRGVAALEAALAIQQEDSYPLDWAMAEANLGNIYVDLFNQDQGDTQLLQQALDSFRAGLRQLTREKVPLLWSTAQSNIGTTLVRLSLATGDRDYLQQGIDAHRLALEELSPTIDVDSWATVEINLADALQALGKDEVAPATLNEAASTATLALSHLSAADQPMLWGKANLVLGNALNSLGGHAIGDADPYGLAAAAFSRAQQVFTRASDINNWSRAVQGQAEALMATQDPEQLRTALGLYGEVLAATDKATDVVGWARLEATVGAGDLMLGKMTDDEPMLLAARSHLEAARGALVAIDPSVGAQFDGLLKMASDALACGRWAERRYRNQNHGASDDAECKVRPATVPKAAAE